MLPGFAQHLSSAGSSRQLKPDCQDPHDGYGSAEAARAAERLVQLGVSVNPPGKRGAVDWGALAGQQP
jgi:hypothetical protein